MSRRELFRTEAIEFQRQHRQWGVRAAPAAVDQDADLVLHRGRARQESLYRGEALSKPFMFEQGQEVQEQRPLLSSLKEVSNLTIVSNTARQVGRDNG